MVVIVFRTRVRADADVPEMEALGVRMYELAASMPGFVSFKDFAAPDGEYVSLVEFQSVETLAAWRDHPAHKEAQRLGREKFFSEYHIQVCTTAREYRFP
ncbi:MAG: antibiotic biosynthesis monooxygenase [Gammaproteobacteria bacterium]|nr:antibiotic biosynthesis monooxygenase [Gammaproteobacteria bacterium]